MSTDWTTDKLRSKFLEFFQSREHLIIPGAPVVPPEDPTALFTTAGMHPLVPYLMGQPHPEGRRLADAQVCVRTTDIDDVGDDTHLTCFEMLGNWSLGDYFKWEAISLAWEFLTDAKWLGIDPTKLAITCFAGDETVPQDTESAGYWEKQGVPTERIFFYGREDNWWGPVGQTGPCGPDTEVFYWTGDGEPGGAGGAGEPATDKNWVEIWNNVFMQFDKRDDGTYEPLAKPNVDTGMGLERTAAILNNQKSVFETDAFTPILAKIDELSGDQKKGEKEEKSRRVIADHLRAAVFIAAAGVVPSNLDRGYVLRRLIRRAIRHGRALGLVNPFIGPVAEVVIENLKSIYPDLEWRRAEIISVLGAEEKKFAKTIEAGLREFEKAAQRLSPSSGQELDGRTVFRLYDTYGFPLEMTQELADERGLIVDEAGFQEAFKTHQEKSRTAMAGTFKSGLADHSEQTIKLHTAAHLLHQALRTVLGNDVRQKGSNITPERLRLDFSYPQKLTPEQVKEVEDLVNAQITAALPVKREEMPPAEALANGALGFFGAKYGAIVSVYTVGDFSKEICTGPHVTNTSELGHFKITKEESAAAGIRRIKAVLE